MVCWPGCRFLEQAATLEWLLNNPEHGSPEEQACRAILSRVWLQGIAAGYSCRMQVVVSPAAVDVAQCWQRGTDPDLPVLSCPAQLAAVS
jgi:hypothetical protein